MRTKIVMALAVLIGGSVGVLAGIPRVPCTIYGLVKDSYGQPYLSNARITFLNPEDAVAARHDIAGLIGYGINFQVSVEMDSGSSDRYADYASRKGEVLKIVVQVDGVQKPLLEASTVTLTDHGTDIALSLTTGTDTDGDGLPDEWERQMMAGSGGAITNITQILPEDDFDGDGASNMHEYLSGTFAFLDYDSFAISDLERTEDGRFIFRFLSVPGKSYGIETSDNLSDSDSWAAGTFSLSADEESTQSRIVGDGYYKTMYIEIGEGSQFMRLMAK